MSQESDGVTSGLFHPARRCSAAWHVAKARDPGWTAMHRLTALLHRGAGVLKLGWWRICAERTGRNLLLMVDGYIISYHIISYHIISYSSKRGYKRDKRTQPQTYNVMAWNLPVFRQNNLITNAQINIKLLTYISCWELKAAWPYYESTYEKTCCAVTNLHCTRAWFHLGAECSKECALAITSTMPQPSWCVFPSNIQSSKLALSP